MISEETCKHWAPLWPKNFHPQRPWWRQPDAPNLGSVFGIGAPFGERPDENRWVRADGVEAVNRGSKWGIRFPGDPPHAARAATPEGYPSAVVIMEMLDRDHALSVPVPLPGQVWVRGGASYLITRVVPLSEGQWMLWFGEGPAHYALNAPAGVCHWPLPGAVLVAGPTPWGRDVPWSP